MWGIGLLFLLVLYFFLIKYISNNQSKKMKWAIVGLSVMLPLSIPFWHYMYPSYHQFQELCKDDNRIEIVSSKKVDYLYEKSSPFHGLTALRQHAYKGFIYRHHDYTVEAFTRGMSWDTDYCRIDCAPQNATNFSLRNACVDKCLAATKDIPDYVTYSRDSDRRSIIKGRLYAWDRQLVSSDYGLMAKSIDYLYYPFGDGWASILGASSGSPPSIKCATRASIDPLQVFPPFDDALDQP